MKKLDYTLPNFKTLSSEFQRKLISMWINSDQLGYLDTDLLIFLVLNYSSNTLLQDLVRLILTYQVDRATLRSYRLVAVGDIRSMTYKNIFIYTFLTSLIDNNPQHLFAFTSEAPDQINLKDYAKYTNYKYARRLWELIVIKNCPEFIPLIAYHHLYRIEHEIITAGRSSCEHQYNFALQSLDQHLFDVPPPMTVQSDLIANQQRILHKEGTPYWRCFMLEMALRSGDQFKFDHKLIDKLRTEISDEQLRYYY